METPLQKIKEFCQDQENEFSVLGYDASQYELGYISAIREINELCEEIPDPTAQLKADKEELLEMLEFIYGYGEKVIWEKVRPDLESLIQKHKQ